MSARHVKILITKWFVEQLSSREDERFMAMQTAEKPDLDALAALPEMKEVLSEIRLVYKIQLAESQ